MRTSCFRTSERSNCMKKILALFLVLATVLSLMTVGAYAAADNALSVSCKLYDGYTVVTVQKSGTVYYTTDGSKPTSKSKKLNSTRIKVSEPCSVRLVSYVKGKPVEYLTRSTPTLSPYQTERPRTSRMTEPRRQSPTATLCRAE